MKALIVDDHPMFRTGIKHTLSFLDRDCDIFEASSCDAAITLLQRTSKIDLVLLDLKLPGMDGIDGLKQFKKLSPDTLIVIMSAIDDPEVIRESLSLGAKGYIPKSSSSEVMERALKQVLSGDVYIPDQLMAQVPGPSSDASDACAKLGLTPRQCDVAKLMVEGLSNKEIGRRMNVSENTVRFHLVQVFKTLGVNSRTEAAHVVTNSNSKLSV